MGATEVAAEGSLKFITLFFPRSKGIEQVEAVNALGNFINTQFT